MTAYLDAYYSEGVRDERERIIKLIDNEIHHIEYNYSSVNDTVQASEKRTAEIKVLNKLKKELGKIE